MSLKKVLLKTSKINNNTGIHNQYTILNIFEGDLYNDSIEVISELIKNFINTTRDSTTIYPYMGNMSEEQKDIYLIKESDKIKSFLKTNERLYTYIPMCYLRELRTDLIKESNYRDSILNFSLTVIKNNNIYIHGIVSPKVMKNVLEFIKEREIGKIYYENQYSLLLNTLDGVYRLTTDGWIKINEKFRNIFFWKLMTLDTLLNVDAFVIDAGLLSLYPNYEYKFSDDRSKAVYLYEDEKYVIDSNGNKLIHMKSTNGYPDLVINEKTLLIDMEIA